MLTEYVPVADRPEACAEFIGTQVPDEGLRSAVIRDLLSPSTSAWAALRDGGVEAIMGAELKHVTPADPEYTYMPASYALISMSRWYVEEPDGWGSAPGLWAHISRDARARGIDRLSIEIPLEYATGIATALADGFTPDVILAAAPTRPGDPEPPDGVRVRRAEPADEEVLLALTLEEADYHAEHTRSGIRGDQDPGPSRRFVQEWLDDEGSKGLPTFVAELDGEVVGMLPLQHIDDGGGRAVPADYGYIASTSVTPRARGRGIGRALAEHALGAAHDLGVSVVLAHYVADNELATPLWQGRGFTPITVTLTKRNLGD